MGREEGRIAGSQNKQDTMKEREREAYMLKCWMVCSPSTTLPGKGSSEWLSESSTSMGASIRVYVRSLVLNMSRTRATVARARVNAARGTAEPPQLRMPSSARPTLRWPLVLQAASGSATSLGSCLGEKTRGQQGRRVGNQRDQRPLSQTTRLGPRWDQK
jgi:hypothetical protein